MHALLRANKLVQETTSKEEITQYLCDKLGVKYIYERYDFVVDKTIVIIKGLGLIIDNKELAQSLRNAHSLMLCFYSFNIDVIDSFDIVPVHKFFVRNVIVKFQTVLKQNEELDQLYIMSNCKLDNTFRLLLEDKLCKNPFVMICGIKHTPIINHYQ